MPHKRKLIVTHHAPDLDACGAVWMLKRFDPEGYADAKIAFVNPGKRISYEEALRHGAELHEITHVDTGKGRFDHHQEERGSMHISATSLVYDYVCSLDENLKDDEALNVICEFITDVDHFQEIYWPEADSYRYNFMIYDLVRGFEYQDQHDDNVQLRFGLECLDSAYAVIKHHISAVQSIEENGQVLEVAGRKGLAIESRNDDTIKIAQKMGYEVVIRKDPKLGIIRIKARPDSDINLTDLYNAILEKDQVGKWYLHPSKKMLLNGSVKDRSSTPSPLTLNQVVKMALEICKQ